jgi:molybdopterin/thiamine biosynthesis adenylyltransferase
MQRPRLKSVFPPMPTDDRTIAIGGADYGLAAELHDDDSRHLWQLLGLLDGSRATSEVVAELRRRDPALPAEDIEEAITALAEAGYVEDAATEAPDAFSAAEVERYRRNVEFFSFFSKHPATGHDLQARLKNSRVTVLGVGGLGSYVALALAAAGVGDLLLVDDDVVEAHNLNRQVLYTVDDIGASKVAAARNRIAAVNPLIEVTAVSKRVAGVEDARACLAGRDLLICAADRPRILIYEWLNAAAVEVGVPWIRGANDGLTVNTFLHVPGETACFECEQRHALSKYPWYGARLQFAKEVLGDRTVNPCTAPIAGLIGSVTALEAVKYLSGAATPVIYNRKLTVDLQTMETRMTEGVRDPECPVCGAEVASDASVSCPR